VPNTVPTTFSATTTNADASFIGNGLDEKIGAQISTQMDNASLWDEQGFFFHVAKQILQGIVSNTFNVFTDGVSVSI